MTGQMDAILSRHGQSVTLRIRKTGETREIKAFLQPILKKQDHPPISATPLGAVNKQRWLYLGSGQVPIAPGDRIRQKELTLSVQETRDIFLGDELLYRWALLQPEKEVLP